MWAVRIGLHFRCAFKHIFCQLRSPLRSRSLDFPHSHSPLHSAHPTTQFAPLRLHALIAVWHQTINVIERSFGRWVWSDMLRQSCCLLSFCNRRRHRPSLAARRCLAAEAAVQPMSLPPSYHRASTTHCLCHVAPDSLWGPCARPALTSSMTTDGRSLCHVLHDPATTDPLQYQHKTVHWL